jgi:MoaA/NifB/PqqE/SkfB family radical SAM enzyme
MKIIREIFRPKPEILYLEPFFGCNYRCFFCVHGSNDRIKSACLDPCLFERLKPVIETVNHIHLTGLGEPLLNPHMKDYLSYFREKNKSFYINTNGSLIDESLIRLLTTSRSELAVSLDAGDEQTYTKMRSGGDWTAVISRLKRVSQSKATDRSPYPLLYLSFHINALNLMSLKKIPNLARELGIKAVKLSWTRLPDRYGKYSIFKHQELVDDTLGNVTAQLLRDGIWVQNEAILGKHGRGCWSFRPMTFVGANGAVAACCSRWIPIGHLSENPFEEIWNGWPRRRIQLAILNKSPEGICRHCPQILGVDYAQTEADFFKPRKLDAAILTSKAENIGTLPALDGLRDGFRRATAALLGGDAAAAVQFFTALDTRFPDHFEIRNNLAAGYLYLGNIRKCRELLQAIRTIPHNEKLIQSNLEYLSGLGGAIKYHVYQ